MRHYVLTAWEKEVIKKYLAGEKISSNDKKVLKYRGHKFIIKLQEDVSDLQAFLDLLAYDDLFGDT